MGIQNIGFSNHFTNVIIISVLICLSPSNANSDSLGLSSNEEEFEEPEPDEKNLEKLRNYKSNSYNNFSISWATSYIDITVSTFILLVVWVFVAYITKIGLFYLNNDYFFERFCLIFIGFIIGFLINFYSPFEIKYKILDTYAVYFIILPLIILKGSLYLQIRLIKKYVKVLLISVIFNVSLYLIMVFLLTHIIAYHPLENISIDKLFIFASKIYYLEALILSTYLIQFSKRGSLLLIYLNFHIICNALLMSLDDCFLSNIDFADIKRREIFYGLFIFIANIFVSLLCGSCYAWIICTFIKNISTKSLYLIILISFSYLLFLSFEICNFSGIISLFVYGISLRNYIEVKDLNMRSTIKQLKILSQHSRSVFFIFIGIFLSIEYYKWNYVFIFTAFILTFSGHLIVTFSFSFLLQAFDIYGVNFGEKLSLTVTCVKSILVFMLTYIYPQNYKLKDDLVLTTLLVMLCSHIIMDFVVKLSYVLFLKKLKFFYKINELLENCKSMNFSDNISLLMAKIQFLSHSHITSESISKYKALYDMPILPPLVLNPSMRRWSLIDFKSSKKVCSFKHTTPQICYSFFTSNNLASNTKCFANTIHLNNSMDCLYKMHTSSYNGTQPLTCVSDSAICLDLQILDAHDNRKMRDDSKIHHIADDANFQPRKKVKHMYSMKSAYCSMDQLAETEDEYHHHAPFFLRHVISTSIRYNGVTVPPTPSLKLKNILIDVVTKPTKNVSFAQMGSEMEVLLENIGNDVERIVSDSEDDDAGITFIAASSTSHSLQPDCSNSSSISSDIDIVEIPPPWKSIDNRNCPLSSSAHHLLTDDRSSPLVDETPMWEAENEAECYATVTESHIDDTIVCNLNELFEPFPFHNLVDDEVDAFRDDIVLPWKLIQKHDSEGELTPRRRINLQRSEDNEEYCEKVPLPWRTDNGSQAIPDQQAPRPLLDHKLIEGSTVSPTDSYDFESMSLHPQVSSHSLRLSEAESRHSEPLLHLHHPVIQMPLASSMTSAAILLSHGNSSMHLQHYDEELEDTVAEIEMIDWQDRVANWISLLPDNPEPIETKTDYFEHSV